MKVLLRILLGLLIIGIIVFFAYLSKDSSMNHCDGLVVKITQQTYPLYTEAEVQTSIIESYEDIEGMAMTDIDVEHIKSIIEKNPYVKHVKVYKEAGSKVIAEVDVRKPLLKFYTGNQNAYLLDSEGVLMPMPQSIPMRILVANGNVSSFSSEIIGRNIFDVSKEDFEDIQIIRNIYNIAIAIQKNREFSELIAQIYYEGNNNYELVPVFGDFVVQIGNADNIAKKMERLRIVYANILPYYDTKNYSAINVGIENQIVCKK
jgi:cell division protein FtsQ